MLHTLKELNFNKYNKQPQVHCLGMIYLFLLLFSFLFFLFSYFLPYCPEITLRVNNLIN